MTRDAHGRRWLVHRRWAAWRMRTPALTRLLLALVPSLLFGVGEGVLLVVGAVLAALATVPAGLALVAFVVETLLVVVVTPFSLLGRALLGRPWTVQVRRGLLVIHYEERVGPWADAGRRVAELAHDVRLGAVPPCNVDPPREPAEPAAAPGPA
ncbi:hypothetical protein GCM10023340_21460 [Nocardioides marinquilinus]|uniref:PH domain-containing protein n=2 Tax=Nocardioides marinquilinus TaxID=1210400 RepID=A0ABP9PMC0_9ACTN